MVKYKFIYILKKYFNFKKLYAIYELTKNI